jgi:trigger factor
VRGGVPTQAQRGHNCLSRTGMGFRSPRQRRRERSGWESGTVIPTFVRLARFLAPNQSSRVAATAARLPLGFRSMHAQDLQTTAEQIEKNRVKLRVEVSEQAIEPAVSAAYRKWAQQIKVPGFRKGKIPRPVIDARVGPEVIREEALNQALPDFYRRALEAEDLEAIAPPEIDIVTFEPGHPLVFEATVDVRPEVSVPDLEAISVEAPSTEVTDDDLTEHLDRLRDRFAELEATAREARRGDFVLIDLQAYRHDQLLEEASSPDVLYEIGSKNGPPRLDEELQGVRPGAILKFNDTLPEAAGELGGQELSFTVLAKEVKAKKLPDLNDDFAKTVGEFEDLDALRADLKERLADVKRAMVDEEIHRKVLEELVRMSDLEPPEALVEGEFEHRLEHLNEDLEEAGLTMAQYSTHVGSTELEIRRDLRAGAATSVKAELLLEQVARDNEISIDQEDISREMALIAVRTGRDVEEIGEQLGEPGRLRALAADIMRRKALDFVVERVNVVNRPADSKAVEASE